MRRRSIARSARAALLGLTIVLTVIAAFGVAALYQARQDYEDTLSDALQLQAGSGRLLAAGVLEEATLRLTTVPSARQRALDAYGRALESARDLAASDSPSQQLVTAAARRQSEIRAHPGARSSRLASRAALARLAARQDARITAARHHARARSRRALAAIVVAGGLALVAALGLVAGLLATLRRPLDDLVRASRALAAGDTSVRVDEDGPAELATVAASFNRMAADVEAATARVEAERRRLDTTVRSLGDALVIVDADDVVVAANPRAAELVGELRVGLRVGEDVPSPAPLDEALATEVSVERDGRTLAVTAARLDAGAGTVWTVRDASERARLERLKSEFVATASHELRSPLTSIKGFVELLSADRGLDERQREFLDIVLVSTNRLVDLVNDLLDVARVEAGRLEIHRRPTDLAEAVTEVATLMRPRLAEKRQLLQIDVTPGLPRAIADPSRVRQILTNLLTNAHLYTADGGHLAIALRPAGVHAIAMEVSDSGRGMTAEQLEHVFDRFQRFDEDASVGAGSQPGTGLGLSIVRSLVDLHGGRIDVDSTPGEGTTFTVQLPRATEPAETQRARQALAGQRVLVVDDEPDVAALIAQTLEGFGVEAVVVNDGAEAMARLRTERFDAITLDILMPGMSGFEMLRELREDAALSRVPVVVVSVFSGRDALSGEWVVAKPIDGDELADALGAAVLAGRVRVLAVGRATIRPHLAALLDSLGIEHEWATAPEEVAQRCAARYFEVAIVDAGLPDARTALERVDLRGRRLRRSIVVVSDDGDDPGLARLDAEPVALRDAGAMVLGLLDQPGV